MRNVLAIALILSIQITAFAKDICAPVSKTVLGYIEILNSKAANDFVSKANRDWKALEIKYSNDKVATQNLAVYERYIESKKSSFERELKLSVLTLQDMLWVMESNKSAIEESPGLQMLTLRDNYISLLSGFTPGFTAQNAEQLAAIWKLNKDALETRQRNRMRATVREIDYSQRSIAMPQDEMVVIAEATQARIEANVIQYGQALGKRYEDINSRCEQAD